VVWFVAVARDNSDSPFLLDIFMRGLTIWLCFGKFANPSLYFGYPTIFRICLGWMSFVIVLVDLEIELSKKYNIEEKQ